MAKTMKAMSALVMPALDAARLLATQNRKQMHMNIFIKAWGLAFLCSGLRNTKTKDTKKYTREVKRGVDQIMKESRHES